VTLDDFSLAPTANGLDYLDSAIMHMHEGPRPRNLKYCILHLHAAVEIFLKARLIQEHWTLACADPGRADMTLYRRGEFKSVTLEVAIARLKAVCEIRLDVPSKAAIEQLTRERNKIAHFGLDTVDDDYLVRIETLTGKCLDVIIQFIDSHLYAGADHASQGRLDYYKPQIVEAIVGIEQITRARFERISAELARDAIFLIGCPNCSQTTLRLKPDDQIRCLFCDRLYRNSDEALAEFVESFDPVLETPELPIRCPECSHDSLVRPIQFRDSPGKDSAVCFQCATRFEGSDFAACIACGEPTYSPSSESVGLCQPCLDYRFPRGGGQR
jgi:hypothetical protein